MGFGRSLRTILRRGLGSTVITSLTASWPTLATAAALILAALFAVAAVAKLADHDQTAADFAALGLRRQLSGPLARLVPVAELGLAAGLLLRPQLGGVLSAITLLGFTVVLSRALRRSRQRGTAVRCSCFGSADRKPISRLTLARNGALLMLAVAAASQPALTQPDLAVLMLATLVALMAVVLVQLQQTRRQLGRIWSVELAGEGR